jgi:ABC-2 type transport system ATP-binding protein
MRAARSAMLASSQREQGMQTLARLVGARKRYGATVALDGVDLAVRDGEVLAVLGTNGAGKSTALGVLTGRLPLDAGRVELLGGDPRDPARRRGIGVMLQEATLADTLKVGEHVRLFSSYYAAPRPLRETLALAGLEDIAGRRYAELSGGQQRRVQFALAICGNAPLLFIDEPTTGLDVEARRNFWTVIRNLRAAGTGIVLTTHYLDEADALAERIVVLAQGRVIAEDSPAGIKSRAAGKAVRARSAVARETLSRWPECESVEAADDGFEVRTRAPEALLRRWLALDPQLADLEVRPLSLEAAFVSLTARPARPAEGLAA